MKRTVAIVALLGLLGFMTGCALLQSLVGVNPETGEVDLTKSPLGSILGYFVPWAGTALGIVGGLFSDIRRRKYVKALSSVCAGVNVAKSMKDDNGKIDVKDLVRALAEEQNKSDMRDEVRKVVKKVEGG